jgi:hypothetical protein
MKAWRFYDTHDYRLEEIPIPQVKEGWVLLKIKVFQLSISEISRIKGMPTMGYKKIRDEILRMRLPCDSGMSSQERSSSWGRSDPSQGGETRSFQRTRSPAINAPSAGRGSKKTVARGYRSDSTYRVASPSLLSFLVKRWSNYPVTSTITKEPRYSP